MPSRISLLCAVAVLSTVAATLVTINADDALETAEPLQSASALPAKPDADKADKMIVCVYPVCDLPVWRYKACIRTTTDENGRSVQIQDRPTGEPDFDPRLLISNMKSSLGEVESKDATIAPHETTASLIIRTTRTNHERIARLLETLRIADQRKQARATKGNKKLTLTQPKIIVPPDPLMQQLEAMPYKQRVHIPIDVEVLVDR